MQDRTVPTQEITWILETSSYYKGGHETSIVHISQLWGSKHRNCVPKR